MYIANSTWSFHRLIPKKMSLLEFPAQCTKLGIKGVELLDFHFKSTDKKYLDNVKEACEKAGVIISAIALCNDFTCADKKELKKQIDKIKKWIPIAYYLGAPAARVFCGTRSVTDAAEKRVIQSYKQVLPLAKKYKVKLAMENHWGLSVNPDAVIRIIKGVNSPWFGSCPDFGNWQPDDKYEATKKVAPYALHAHAKSHDFLKNGEEKNTDFKKVIGILKKSGYDGPLSIEFEGAGDQIEGTRKTVKLIKKYI